MRRMPWATYLWPGLPQLWSSGSWSGLALAGGFAALVDLNVLASFVWVELLGPWALRFGWFAAGLLWLVCAIASVFRGGGNSPASPPSAEGLFRAALSEYLQGNWFEAERALGRLLQLDPRDVDARLLLATLLRHTGRLAEAASQLKRLELLRDAEKWSCEIAAERRLLALAHENAAASAPETSNESDEGPGDNPEMNDTQPAPAAAQRAA